MKILSLLCFMLPFCIFANNLPAPTNLNAELQDGNVILTWEHPTQESQTIFFESFEDINSAQFPPQNWLNIDADNDGNAWILFDVPPSTEWPEPAYHGLNAAASYSWFNGSVLTPDNWLITPAIELTGICTLSWAVAAQRPNYSQEHYKVYIGDEDGDIDSFTDLLHEETMPANDISWYIRSVDLSAYSGQTKRIAFRHTETTDLFAIKIDAVEITSYPEISAEHLGFYVFRNNEPISQLLDTEILMFIDDSPLAGENNYYVKAFYAENQYSDPSNTATVDIVSNYDNVNEVTMPFYVKSIYPNPVNDKSKLEVFSSESGFINVKIFDIRGRLHISKAISHTGKETTDIEIGSLVKNLNNGMYILQLESQNNRITKKITLIK